MSSSDEGNEELQWEERPALSETPSPSNNKEKHHKHKDKKNKDKKKHKHKHKHNKKDKKNKDKGEKRKKHDNSSGEGSDVEEDTKKPKQTQPKEVVESDGNATKNATTTAQREEWMTSAPSSSNWLLGSRGGVEEKKPTKEDKEEEPPQYAAGLHVRGDDNNNNNASNDPKRSDPNKSKTPSWMVGDGGSSWRTKALRRAREQASESGESVDSLVEGRFGNAEELEKRSQRGRYEESGDSRSHRHHHNDRDRDREERDRERGGDRRDRDRDNNRERETDRNKDRDSRSEREERDKDKERVRDRENERESDRHQRKESDDSRHKERGGRVFEDPSKRMMTPSTSDHRLKWGSRKPSHSDTKIATTLSSSSSSTAPSSSRNSPPPPIRNDRFDDKREENTERDFIMNIDENEQRDKIEDSEKASQDINKLVAQVMKAKLKGDKDLVKKLEQEIEEVKRAISKVVVKIPMMDSKGRPITGNDKTLKPDANLQTLLSKERFSESRDYDNEYANALTKTKKGTLNEDEDFDRIGEERPQNNKQKKKEEKHKQKQQEKEKQQAISNFKRAEAQEGNCWFCYTSDTFDKSLMVSTGNHVYLSLPSKGTLAPGHCLIVPIRHAVSVTSVDEDVFTEIQNFKKCLIQMFASLKKECIFLETVMNLKKQSHTCFECIPITK
eukprot:TRINITY_DN8748_c0_g1_i1.p1 TRINITY_DN8748_c0_g1~~TRINITY_DN8748_c0_g1_i1.p1  ORF type:complete len:671 (-),score=167.52 TRINITY_DN8748_c0_g1_i1:69-2081(-)